MTSTPADFASGLTSHPWFFCGIGGSGMLPLALILRAQGAEIAGSDRSRDQGRTPDKFAWLVRQGIALYPQDGRGIVSAGQTLVASAAVEDSVPEVVRARELGCPRMSRAELLATLFNRARLSIAVGGTSGKSTVTGMIGWIFAATARDPTIMNGAVMKNFRSDDAPFASARLGAGDIFVSEVDESDGSIALYRPAVAVLTNVTLDHKSLDELRSLFDGFLGRAAACVLNLDDPETRALIPAGEKALTFAIDHPDAALRVEPGSISAKPTSIAATLLDGRDGSRHPLRLQVPGRHNLANALAALSAASAAGVPLADGVQALASFAGLARRFDIVGASASGITVIDDFAHNPDKVAATLATLKAHPGRILAYFQPHGYGPLRQMGVELAEVLAARLAPEDRFFISEPVYYGGTVVRSIGSERIVELIAQAAGREGVRAEHCPTRAECGDRIVALARPGDRIVVMGARDDTLTTFARELLGRLG